MLHHLTYSPAPASLLRFCAPSLSKIRCRSSRPARAAGRRHPAPVSCRPTIGLSRVAEGAGVGGVVVNVRGFHATRRLAKRDFYDVLGLQRNADKSEVRLLYL